jgi:RNA polymerase subunit RPABC4/transcription elongation factor Spt4
MKKKECPSCAMHVDESAPACPICGYEFPRQARWVQWVAVLLVLAMLLVYLL